MNRLQKKCFIGSAGFHLLLLLIVLVGPAFLSSRDKSDNLPVLDFVPYKTVDAMVSGGGNPNAKPPPPAAPAPQAPTPVAAPAPKPSPPPEAARPEPAPKEAIKEPRPEPESLETGKERKRKVEVSTTLVKRNTNAVSDAQAKEMAEAKRQTAAAIRQAVSGIQGGLSESTSIELKGSGGGGVPYANWLQAVRSVYQRAWVVPQGITDNSATTEVTVTIARDGTVISARITNPSGNAGVDQSVQATLNRVKYTAPLPDEAKEDQRTVTIVFDVKSKLFG